MKKSKLPDDYNAQKTERLSHYLHKFSQSTQLIPVKEVHEGATFRVQELRHLELMAKHNGQCTIYYLVGKTQIYRLDAPFFCIRAYCILDNGRILSHVTTEKMEWVHIE